MRIIVDVMGGDHAPVELIKGALDGVNEYNIEVLLVGREEIIEKELAKYDFPRDKVEILNAEDVITNEDNPTYSIRRKKGSSMVVGLNALNEGLGDGFISAGSTGALLAGGLFITKRIENIQRAALTIPYPTFDGFSLVLDAGANVDCKPEYLKQFALMGSIYMENVLDIKNPRVGLINIGTEVDKGNQLTRNTYHLLNDSNINFVGNIEGRNIPMGEADILICDGFTGNIVLKLSEGVAISIFDSLKEIFTSDLKSKMAALALKPKLKALKSKLDYREYGGAPLLGTKKPIVKAHGSSDAFAIKNGIRQLIQFVEKDVIRIIEENIDELQV